ncbi:MAG: hypothetical protein M1833_002102 [Piccolia ochrophora]|nr:MAG: hypothetical protein M1833_002102 [Piccolia ochrophora]
MLKTKSLNQLLAQNTSQHVTSIFIFTPTGALLAHSQPTNTHPMTIRTQATLAANLWASYTNPSTSSAINSALPSPPPQEPPPSDQTPPKSLALSLATTNLAIHALRPSLLLALIGPTSATSSSSTATANTSTASSRPSTRSSHSPSSSSATPPQTSNDFTGPGSGSTSRSSLNHESGRATRGKEDDEGSSQSRTLGILRVRAEAMASWLDKELGSFEMPMSRQGESR